MTISIRNMAATIAAAIACASLMQAQDPNAELRDKAVSFNRITGDEATINKLRELRKDREGLKKLLAEAKSLAKEKEKEAPLNYTANFILARAAQSIKDYESGEFF